MQNSFSNFPKNRLKKKRHTNFTVLRCQGQCAKNLKKIFRKFVTGCDIKATKCDKKNYRKVLLEPIL